MQKGMLNTALRVTLLLFLFFFQNKIFLQFCLDHQRVLVQIFSSKFKNVNYYLRRKIRKFVTHNQLKHSDIQLFKIHIISFLRGITFYG